MQNATCIVGSSDPQGKEFDVAAGDPAVDRQVSQMQRKALSVIVVAGIDVKGLVVEGAMSDEPGSG